jgi:hypothetical protein
LRPARCLGATLGSIYPDNDDWRLDGLGHHYLLES